MTKSKGHHPLTNACCAVILLFVVLPIWLGIAGFGWALVALGAFLFFLHFFNALVFSGSLTPRSMTPSDVARDFVLFTVIIVAGVVIIHFFSK